MKGSLFIRGKDLSTVTIATVVGLLCTFAFVQAATTISTDITTGGNIYASSTMSISGGTSLHSTLGVSGAIAASSTFQVTGATTHYGTVANNSTVTFGSSGTALSSAIFGLCSASVTVTASSTGYANCTGATGVDSTYTVIVQATSSLPSQLVLTAASSTATSGTISLQFLNTGITGGNVSASVNSLKFWAFK